MITLEIYGCEILLTADNECEVKELLKPYPGKTEVTILETGEVLQINDIFNYE